MTNRLKAIASQINNGTGVVDVGTDHGYIPVSLALNDYAGNIIASDINEGPLNTARRVAEEAGVFDRIDFLLCSGLDACPQDKIDTIVIAGMGGDLICDILDKAEWCMSPKYRLILQPMTKAEILRYWLVNNEFSIIHEELAEDAGTIYQVLTAQLGKHPGLSDAELFIGKAADMKSSQLHRRLLDELIKRFESALAGLQCSHTRNTGREKIYTGILNELKEME